MAFKKSIYISGPRMGTSNPKSNGPVLGKKRKARKKK
jgi:hypothetical protein